MVHPIIDITRTYTDGKIVEELYLNNIIVKKMVYNIDKII
jgi:hypothetical protein